MTPKSKVQAWLTNENQSPVFNTTKLQNTKKRRKSVAGISKVLLERPSGNNSSNQNASTDNEDISLELAKILAKDDKQQSTESTPEFLQQAIDEHEPYRPPSFQNYSSDSAKALLAKYEAGKTSIGSIGSGKITLLVKYIWSSLTILAGRPASNFDYSRLNNIFVKPICKTRT